MEHKNKYDIDQVLSLLEQFGQSDVSRLQIKVSDHMTEGDSKKEYHHGRCDIASPWACGTAFDVLEEESDNHENH